MTWCDKHTFEARAGAHVCFEEAIALKGTWGTKDISYQTVKWFTGSFDPSALQHLCQSRAYRWGLRSLGITKALFKLERAWMQRVGLNRKMSEWVCGYLKRRWSVGPKSKAQLPSVQSEEFDGGPYCHLPLHHESSRMLLVHRAAELELVGKACGIPMALQTDPSLPRDLALCGLSP